MGVSGSPSAGTELGIWGGVTKPCEKDSCLFVAHTPPFYFSQPPEIAASGVAHEMVLPLTDSYLLTLPRLGHKELVHSYFPLWWQNCDNREKTEAVDEKLSQLWGLCQPDSHSNHCHLFRCSYETPRSQDGLRLLLMRVEGCNQAIFLIK